MTEHRLIDDTLITVPGGIIARCMCGWVSRPCFTSLIASVEFQDHQTGPECDRITQLLDVALHALRAYDVDGAILALEEAVKTVETLPKKVEP